jgi:hypothetical protein
VPKGKRGEVRLRLNKVPLQKGTYYIVAGIFSEDCRTPYEMRLRAKKFRILQSNQTEGLISVKGNWEFKHV